MHVISFLGKSGRDRDEKPVKSSYENTTPLPLKEGGFHNSLEVVLSSFPDATHYFLATSKAYDFQENLLKEIDSPHLLKFSQSQWLVLGDEDLDAPMHEVLDLLEKLEKDKDEIVLDVTHGFRHQPIIGSLSALLGDVVYDKKIHLLFAKVTGKSYTYILLDDYLDLGKLSWILTSFSQTLTIPPKFNIGSPLVKALGDFCEKLHANLIKSLFDEALPRAQEEVEKAKLNDEYKPLLVLIGKSEELLKQFTHVSKGYKENHTRYYQIAVIMQKKHYTLIAYTYLYEAIRWYLRAVFENNRLIKKNDKDHYGITTDISNCLKAEVCDKKIFCDDVYKFKAFYKDAIDEIKSLMDDVREIRNHIAHINEDFILSSNETDSGKTLSDRLFDLCIKNDVLDIQAANISVWKKMNPTNNHVLSQKISDYLKKTLGFENISNKPEKLHVWFLAVNSGDFKKLCIPSRIQKETHENIKSDPKIQKLSKCFNLDYNLINWQKIEAILND